MTYPQSRVTWAASTTADLDGGNGFDVLEGRARVVTPAGDDVTAAFVKGAFAALDMIRKNKIEICFLKDKSPS